MKRYIYTILMIFIFFATSSLTFAKQGSLGNVLDLGYGVEKITLNNFGKLKNYRFVTEQKKYQFSKFKKIDNILKKEFIRMYKSGELDYYAINGVIKNYNLFLYHTNKRFQYERLTEVYGDTREGKDALLRNFTLSRNYYRKVKHIIERNRNK